MGEIAQLGGRDAPDWLRIRVQWIFGAVPLGLQENAKGGEPGTQLASLKQVSAVLQRSHPRAKRKPDPRIMHSCPDAHRRRRYCWHILRRDVSVDSDNRWAEVSLFLRVTCAYV